MFDIDISSIVVRKALTKEDFQKAFDIRWNGYKKYFDQKTCVVDNFDSCPNAVILLAIDNQENPLGTLRILNRQYGKIEIDKFIDLDSYISETEKPCAEATRFSIPNSPLSRNIKFALWKAFYTYCLHNGVNTILIAVRPCAARDYKRLLFERIENSTFKHQDLGDVQHDLYKLNVLTAAEKFKSHSHPLYHFFCIRNHPNIQVI